MRLGLALSPTRPRPIVPPEPPATLGDSVVLTASGPGITLSSLNGDGTYTITTTGASTTATYVGSGQMTGDLLWEVEVISHANGFWFGWDNAVPSARSYAVMDEAGALDQGNGPGYVNIWRANGSLGGGSAFTGKLYLERVGAVMRARHGASWAAAKAASAIVTTTPLDTDARYGQVGNETAGAAIQWKVRLISHPG